MKTLYVSDLDGTLLRSDETTSKFTNNTINSLVEKGMMFSYATARSYHTSKKVTEGLNAPIPVIVYNGTFILDNKTGDVLLSNYFEDDIKDCIKDLVQNDIYPIVYSFIDDAEKFTYVEDMISPGTKKFLNTRRGDGRDNPVVSENDLYRGNLFHITCIDDEEKLKPLYEKYKETYHCVFYKDMYTNEQWLEIMPITASKSNAIRQLKEYLKCDKVVVFGDHKNDMDMFQMADECYAVDNAIDGLKEIATDVIESNDNDGVAKWLSDNYI